MKPKNLQKSIGNITDLNVLRYGVESNVALYVYYYKRVPSILKRFCTISIEDLIKYFKKDYELVNLNHYRRDSVSEVTFKNNKDKVVISIYKNEYNKESTKSSIDILYDIKNPPKNIISFINEHTFIMEDANLIYFIVNSMAGLTMEAREYKKRKIDIEENYNEDFYKLNSKILNDLAEEKSGIHIFHGIPGSGKSTYIKYLINNIDKRFVYCPSTLSFQLSDPSFLKLMISQGENIILIIEDAEEALTDKGSGRNSAVSNLLNLSDGIIGDALKIQIIATFNTDFSNIDPAILRRGRLLSLYEFKELETKKAQSLLNSLGYEDIISSSMTLADIYNYSSSSYNIENKKIGL